MRNSASVQSTDRFIDEIPVEAARGCVESAEAGCGLRFSYAFSIGLAARVRGFMRGGHLMTPLLAAQLAVMVLLTSQPAAAAEDASAHAIAEKFARSTNDAKTATAKADDAKKRTEAERLKAVKKAAEAKRKTEDAKRKAETARARAELMKADEAEMLARAHEEANQREEEQRRALAELEIAEAERIAAENKALVEKEAREAGLVAEAERTSRETTAREAAERDRLEAERSAAATRAADDARKASQAKAADARARSETEAARKMQAARAEAEQMAREARKAEAAHDARQAEDRRLADELAKEARIAEEQRAASERQAADHLLKAEAAAREALEREAEQQARARAEAEYAASERAAREADQQRLILEAEREAEAIRLTEKIRKARDLREARKSAGPEDLTSAINIPDATTMTQGRQPTIEQVGTRVTVLLMMVAGDRGIRRWNKSADPVLCLEDVCYVSQGPDTAAKRMPRSTAFGPGIALGSRAGACNNALGCVFRDVDLEGAKALLQPIDLRIVRHDRREASEVRADETCAIAGGKLSCRAGVSSATWRAWIVPEAVAARAGATTLEAALSTGLNASEASIRGDR